MGLRQLKLGFTLLELAEAVEPDIEKVVAAATTSAGKPTLAEIWPEVRDALDKAVATPSIGNIRL